VNCSFKCYAFFFRAADINDLKILRTSAEVDAVKIPDVPEVPRRDSKPRSSSAVAIPQRKNQQNGSGDAGSYNQKDETFRKRTYSGW
jgi:hypothetical protein